MGDYSARVLTSDEYEQWNNLTSYAPSGSVFSSTAWLSAISRLFNRELRLWGVYRGKELAGGIGLIRFNLFPLIKLAGYLPLTPYTSIVIRPRNSDKETKNASYRLGIIDALAEVMEKEADVVEMTGHPSLMDIRPFVWRRWNCIPMYTYILGLSDPKQIWKRAYGALRRQIRKCQQEDIRIERGGNSQALYQLYRLTYEKQGRRVYVDEGSFEGLYDVLKEQDRLDIYIAEQNGQPISGLGIVKDYHGVIHNWIAGTHPDYLSSGVASYMLWRVIEDFAEQGFQWFDLNGADVPALAHHKSQFNGELKLHHMVTSRNIKARLFDSSFRKAQEWGIADWLKQRFLV